MSTKVTMPQLGESVVEGKVSRWLVKEGDTIVRDQPIVEVSTDKVDVEIPAPGSGRLEKILIAEGATVKVGTELALIGDGEGPPKKAAEKKEEAAAPPQPKAPAPPAGASPPASAEPPKEPAREKEKGEGGRVSPLVKRLAEEHQVDLSKISGTGIEGRITKQDLLRHIGKEAPEPSTAPKVKDEMKESPSKSAAATTAASEFTEYKPQPYEPQEGDQVIPFTRLRKMIAEHMIFSKRTAPHVTTIAEVDMTNVARLRDEKKAGIKRETGEELTFLPFVLSATLQAIADFPSLNASVVNQSLVIKKEVHLGIAVETDKGLIVPVIRRAREKSVLGLARAASELAKKAREGTLTPDEGTGGTFTISNPGRKGNLFGTPILFQPQVGILRMGEIVKRAVVVEVNGEDAITIRLMMYLALSYDHRVIDGATGNLFLHRVKEILEAGVFSF